MKKTGCCDDAPTFSEAAGTFSNSRRGSSNESRAKVQKLLVGCLRHPGTDLTRLDLKEGGYVPCPYRRQSNQSRSWFQEKPFPHATLAPLLSNVFGTRQNVSLVARPSCWRPPIVQFSIKPSSLTRLNIGASRHARRTMQSLRTSILRKSTKSTLKLIQHAM